MAESSTSRTVIKTADLNKNYGDLQVLKSLDLEVPEHAIFGFLGPNGAGKTTTMKILLGLSTPTSGRAEIFGKDVQEDGLVIRSRLGYLPQHPTFPDYMTAREVLAFTGRFFFHKNGRALPSRIEEMLDLVGLENKADRKVGGFSGGERQRLGIAQAQIHRPELLILDEPAAALDPLGRHDVLAIMDKLKSRATIFYSTHILDDVQQVSDTVAILNQGELVAQGPIDQLLRGEGEVVFRLRVQGPWQKLEENLSGRAWVSGLDITERQESVEIDVCVADLDAPENRLLQEALRVPGIVVLEYRRKELELEDAFIEIIKGGRDD